MALEIPQKGPRGEALGCVEITQQRRHVTQQLGTHCHLPLSRPLHQQPTICGCSRLKTEPGGYTLRPPCSCVPGQRILSGHMLSNRNRRQFIKKEQGSSQEWVNELGKGMCSKPLVPPVKGTCLQERDFTELWQLVRPPCRRN